MHKDMNDDTEIRKRPTSLSIRLLEPQQGLKDVGVGVGVGEGVGAGVFAGGSVGVGVGLGVGVGAYMHV